MSLSDKSKLLPAKPGVYIFKGAKGEVLYVGKAKNLKSRVRSYFSKGRDERAQIAFLIRRAKAIDFIVTDTEKEALLLENTLIKEHRPRYNLDLKDDKSYISIRIGADHPFPGISLTRKIKKDGALYFGPYDSSLAAREAVESITRYFRVRSCTDTEFANRVRPCLKHDIGRCTAPCVGRVTNEEYASQVDEAAMFLSGKSRELIRILDSRMDAASDGLRYEEAARIRDAIGMLKGLVEKQKVVRHGGGDHDVLGIAKIESSVALCVLRVRGGTLFDKRIFNAADSPGGAAKLIEEFLLQHYRDPAEIPPVIAVSDRPDALSTLATILGDRRQKSVKLLKPLRGPMHGLVELACTNAGESIEQRRRLPDDSAALERLARKLKLGAIPGIIECIDISNLSGREAVGSLVSFSDGKPDKSGYRLYNIRTLNTPDDYAMMHEVISRRFAVKGDFRSKGSRDRPLPDLLLVDGGKGQLAVSVRAMKEIGFHVPLAAIAKGEKKGHADQVFIPGRKNPLNMKRGSKELLLLMRIRDEAHRFGIGAHRRKRGKTAFQK